MGWGDFGQPGSIYSYSNLPMRRVAVWVARDRSPGWQIEQGLTQVSATVRGWVWILDYRGCVRVFQRQFQQKGAKMKLFLP